MLCSVLALLSACAPSRVAGPDDADGVAGAVPADTQQMLIVDCLLPGQVRKLGQALTYLAPRRPVKTAAADCEIRGGEYVAYDRADYATALKIWLPQAREGDPEAQTYVAQIYEQGLGVEPDYVLAAEWYRKAAEQGYARAQIGLGYLYEKGLGVSADLVEAMNWYRRASGLSGDLEFVSSVEQQARATQAQELTTLRGEVERLTEQTDTLKRQLTDARRKLKDARSQKQTLEGQIQALQRRKDALRQPSSASQIQDLGQLDQELQQRHAQLQRQQSDIDRLQGAADQYRSELTRLAAQQSPGGPSIDLIDPPLMATRGVPSVTLRSIAKQREIAGRITAPAGIKLFNVNQQAVPVADDGAFRTMIPLTSAQTEVNMVVVDQRGRRAVLQFVIVTPATGPAAAPTAGAVRAGAVPFGRFHALIIGNNSYTYLPKLNTAINDAEGVAEVLRGRYGFSTTVLVDADRRAIISALYELRQRLSEDDNLLIYYAGHGELDLASGQGYWLPVDAETANPANWLSNDAVTDMLNAIRARHIMVVADSCYSGTMTRTSIARLDVTLPPALKEKWLRLMAHSRSRTALTSGGLAPVLDEGGGRNSVFAKAFIAALQTNHDILQGYSLYQSVTDSVRSRAARLGVTQIPEYAPIRRAGHETGQFLFMAGR